MRLNALRSTLYPLRLTCRRGQFIPMASMVVLSVVVFMVGVVNVYTISRAKLRAQNLADAAAMFVAGHMVQSLNNAADKNEWLNHIYGDPNDPRYSTAGNPPCEVPGGDTEHIPPGIGCFARQNTPNPNGFVFGDIQAAYAYAMLVEGVTKTQHIFESVFNQQLSAGSGNSNATTPALQATLYHAIPDLQKPEVYTIVFNSQQTRDTADRDMKYLDEHPPPPNAPAGGLTVPPLMEINFDVQDVYIKYKPPILHLPPGPIRASLKEVMRTVDGGGDRPAGYMALRQSSLDGWGQGKNQLAAGAMVRITTSLIGLGQKAVQARSTAYIVMTSGSLGPDTQGSFHPTYYIKLGKPL